ncbi:hypothetical protein EV207_13824 [Scopulibacillus darangshiensis]|uniref:Spore germination protein GerPA/GerPF n=1 Tax=Scopulibacillus darangshiensis TaxID=442528 RepID=A0A4R2NKB1_9BACL|nr:hypothetical protein [Scopulibacillus darangshiensis]TCP21937.1 hypothetical protein EV207_13824 [Scopulibacillus darangshiensis]
MKMHVKNIKVAEVKQSSAIFSGDNTPMGWRNVKKVNDGFGSLIGNKNEFMNGEQGVVKRLDHNNS